MNIRDEALSRLENFSNNNLGKYAAERNFDPGPVNRNNTSLLSQYISHRIIDEQETIQSAYNKLPFKKIEKFVQCFLENLLERLARNETSGLG